MSTDKPLLLENVQELAEHITHKIEKLLTGKYTNTFRIAHGVIRQELESWLAEREAALQKAMDIRAAIKAWREKQGGPWLETDPIELFTLLNEIENDGFEMAHELRACGHSRGDYRDANYIPGKPETYTGSERCVGCEREAELSGIIKGLQDVAAGRFKSLKQIKSEMEREAVWKEVVEAGQAMRSAIETECGCEDPDGCEKRWDAALSKLQGATDDALANLKAAKEATK
jgi:hypothetical protein